MAKLHPLIQKYIDENYPLFGPTKVAKELNKSPESIVIYAKKHNLKISKIDGIGLEMPKFKYDLDFYKLFGKIDEKMSYWIGFFWADGTINKHSSLIIEITKDDADNIKYLFLSIFPFVISERKRNGRKAQITFRVHSKESCSLLENMGKYPKTSESHKKIFEFLKDEKLQISFLRGLIDGDGSFYWNEREKYAQFTLASNYKQDWSFLCDFLKEFSPHVAKDCGTNGKSSVIRITGRNNVINFIKFMKYDTNHIGLDRKVKKANDILQKYNEYPPKDSKKHVLQYDANGKFIKEWGSCSEIRETLGYGENGIRNCLDGISKKSHGFIWKYKN